MMVKKIHFHAYCSIFFRLSGTDLVPGLGAFVACIVLPVQIGILVGMAINIAFILYSAARPKLRIETLAVSSFNP